MYFACPDIEKEYQILKLESDIAINKAMLEAYIEERSYGLVDSMYAEDGEEAANDQNKNNGNKNNKGIIETILGSIQRMFSGILDAITGLFGDNGSVSEDIINDPNKRAQLGYDPDSVSEKGLEELYNQCGLLKKFCEITGMDIVSTGQTADNAIKGAKVAAALSGVSVIGLLRKLPTLFDRGKKAKKEIDDTANVVKNNLNTMSGEKQAECKKRLGIIQRIANNEIIKSITDTFKAVVDNAVDHVSLGIFDNETSKDIKNQWKQLKDDQTCPRNMVEAMKIPEKYDQIKDYIITTGDHPGVKELGYEDENAVDKSFKAFLEKVRTKPDTVKKSEVKEMFKDMKKIRGLKRRYESGNKNNDNGGNAQEQQPQNQS